MAGPDISSAAGESIVWLMFDCTIDNATKDLHGSQTEAVIGCLAVFIASVGSLEIDVVSDGGLEKLNLLSVCIERLLMNSMKLVIP